MSDPTPDTAGADEPRLADEMAAIPYEPLLPVEKRLIAWSLILGVALLGVLAWLSSTLFPIDALPTGTGPTGPAPAAARAK